MHTSHTVLLLSFGIGACALNARPADGLVSDELGQGYQFGTAASSDDPTFGAPDVPLSSCKNPALFIRHVLPRFIEHCVECHDGTKLKASFALYLANAASDAPSDQEGVCDLTLTTGVLAERLQSPILTEVDPARPDLEHEFKFADAATFALYRDAVMMWLVTE